MFKIKVHMKIGEPVTGYAELPDTVGGVDFGKYLLLIEKPETPMLQPKLIPMVNVNWLEVL